jgi:hypothetical protein
MSSALVPGYEWASGPGSAEILLLVID